MVPIPIPCDIPPPASRLHIAVLGERSWNFLFTLLVSGTIFFYLGEMNKDYLHPFSTKNKDDASSVLQKRCLAPFKSITRQFSNNPTVRGSGAASGRQHSRGPHGSQRSTSLAGGDLFRHSNGLAKDFGRRLRDTNPNMPRKGQSPSHRSDSRAGRGSHLRADGNVQKTREL